MERLRPEVAANKPDLLAILAPTVAAVLSFGGRTPEGHQPASAKKPVALVTPRREKTTSLLTQHTIKSNGRRDLNGPAAEGESFRAALTSGASWRDFPPGSGATPWLYPTKLRGPAC